MAITVGRAKQHVADWSARLAKFPTRASWPRHLFHTCQLEVAVAIIRDSVIRCRNGMAGNLICDVANQGALWNNPEAHDFVRLYFRPRNSFHLKTEGIKSTTDNYRVDPHMSIPVAFVFDFVGVMTRAEAAFLSGNFARSGAQLAHGDAQFEQLDFSLIYHDGPLNADVMQDVHNMRMSEVVVREELDLSVLSHIVCRTPHELRTLEFMLRQQNISDPALSVEQRGTTFMRRGIFIDEIYTVDTALMFKFHAPITSPRPEYDVRISNVGASEPWENRYKIKAGRWRIAKANATPETVWRVEIEGCLAYLGRVPSGPAEGQVVG